MPNTKKLFSVIIPIYNSEEYLEECLDSVINQDLGFKEHIEMILVNDGSQDKSEDICLTYVKKYPENIIYIKKKNGGVSSARNLGIKKAKGKYINFLDSDDKFSLNTFSVVNKIFSENNNIKICSIKPLFFDKVNGETDVSNCYKDNRVVNLLEDWKFSQQAVNNVFILKELTKNHYFNETLSIGEDALFMNSLLINNPKYYVTHDAIYYQRRRSNNSSLSETAFFNKSFYCCTVKDYFLEIINYCKNKLGNVPMFIQKDIAYFLGWLIQSKSINDVLNRKEIKLLIKQIKLILQSISLELIDNLENMQLEEKFLLNLMKNEDLNIHLNNGDIQLFKESNKINFIYANYDLIDYMHMNDFQKLKLACIELSKFYKHNLKIIDDLNLDKVSLEKTNDSLEKEILNIKKTLEIQAQKQKELNEIIEQKDSELDIINELYNQMVNSKSWKLTKPLRVVKNFFRK